MTEDRGQPAFLAISWVALLAAPLLIVWMILSYGVNVAVFDQIHIGAFLARNHDRLVPALSDLVAQHNESRKFFPRLIFFYLARLTGWDVRYEMGVIFLIACATLVCVAALARRTLPQHWLPATAIASLLLFSPVQWWNWLFGIQVVVYLPTLMLGLALLALESRRSVPWQVALAALCCLVATYSYANGMALWVVVFPAIVFSEGRGPRAEGRVMSAWLALAAIAIGTYFIGYHRPPTHPQLATDPLGLVAFVLAFLGHPLVWSDAIPPNVLAGGVVLTLFCAFAFAARRRGLPWIVLGAYSLISAAVTAAGRLGYGLATAVEPRYTTFAIPLLVGLVMLAFMAIPAQLRRAGVAALALLLVMHVLASRREWWYARADYRDRLISRAATQWSQVLADTSALRRFVDPDPERAKRVIAELAAIGYVNPPPVTSAILRGTPTKGQLEGAMRLPDGERVFYGWAVLPEGRPADAALIARVEPDGEHVVALSHRTVARADLAPRSGVLDCGWDLPVTREIARPGFTYTAWAYDTEARRAYKLRGSLISSSRAKRGISGAPATTDAAKRR